jgi:biotin transporter BioY
MRLIAFAIYLGIGAMLHALFVGAQFDWTSAWTFGWLFGWPIMLFVAGWTFALIVCVGAGIAYAIWSWLESIAEWRERRRKQRARSAKLTT